jgi:hypothetical protein
MKVIIHKSRHAAGLLLIECLMYIAVFAILTGIGTACFYLCWDQSKAVVYATDDIGAAFRAGEHWRADVRNATGPISVEQTADGQQIHIPGHDNAIVYRFASGEVRREIPNTQRSDLLLAKVNSSQMTREMRDGVIAWRWELDLAVRRPETHLPLLFTFEAAQPKP